MGRKNANRPRPVIMKFMDDRYKWTVWKNYPKLKGRNISVSDDFSVGTRQIRKQLWESTKEARKAGLKLNLIQNNIKIEDKIFECKNAETRIPVTGRNASMNPVK